MEKIIVYYSKDGNTRSGAKILGEITDSEVIELKEQRKGNFIQALMKKGSKLLGEPWNRIKDAKKVFLMCPIWASSGVPAMNSFLKEADLSEKEVIIITFQQFKDLSGSERAHNQIKALVEKQRGQVKECFALIGGKMGHFAGDDRIRKQIDSIFDKAK